MAERQAGTLTSEDVTPEMIAAGVEHVYESMALSESSSVSGDDEVGVFVGEIYSVMRGAAPKSRCGAS